MAPAPPLPVTEDTPPDMLAGSMDLRVVLPGGRVVKMSAERCTPMMDLLVQVTTANKMAPGGYVLQPVGERGVLPYKPSTPIGALDTWTIQIVPKARAASASSLKKAPLKPNNQQPFEQTFRLQVHLPRNQLFVARVSPKSLLSDVLTLACSEKNLDPNKYELRHPANLEERLRPEWTLADYKLQEVTLVAKGNRPLGSGLSSSDIMALQKEEEKRRQQVRANGGTGSAVLGLMLGKNSQSSGCDGSISSDSLGGRSISPARSDETPSPPGSSLPPPRPTRKRRPAPKPPTQAAQPQQPPVAVISHSRNSSDSSGYHEASILSESPESNGMSSPSGTLPRRSKLTSTAAQPPNVVASHNLSRSLSNLTHMSNGEHKAGQVNASMQKNGHSVSTTSLASTGFGKKKKAAPPPPPLNRPTVPGQLSHEQRTASLSTLSSQSSGDSFDRELYSRSATLERPSSSQSSTMSNVLRHESLPEEVSIDESESIPEQNEASHCLKDTMPDQVEKAMRSSSIGSGSGKTALSLPLSENAPRLEEPRVLNHHNLTHTDDIDQHPDQHSTNQLPVHVEKKPVPLSPKTELRKEKCTERRSEETSAPKPESASPVSKQPRDLAATRSPSNCASPRASLPDVVSDSQSVSMDIEKEIENVTNELEAVALAEQAKEMPSVGDIPSPKTESPNLSIVDWEYHLPAPPTEFQDTQSPSLTTDETDRSSEVPVYEETAPEVLPPAEFTDIDQPAKEHNKHLNQMIEKECPLIQHLVKGVTKVNPLFNNEKYEAEILEEARKNSKESTPSPVNGNGGSDEEDWKPQQISEQTDPRKTKDQKTPVEISFASESNQGNQLKNFTISAYQRPRDTDLIFNGSNEATKEEFEFKKPVETTIYNRNRESSSSTSTNIPRNNSFSAKNNVQNERSFVKRSTSHVSLINPGRTFRAKSIGNLAIETTRDGHGSQVPENGTRDGHEGLRKTTSEANISQDYGRSSRLAELQDQFLQWQEQLLRQTQPDIPLQSLQVLRSILSPSQEVSRDKTKENKTSEGPSSSVNNDTSTTTKNNESSETPEVSTSKSSEVTLRRQSSSAASNSTKRYSYQGPPAVNFSTWSERPKSQVSIKVDNDYRIGKGQNSSLSTSKKISQCTEDSAETKEDRAAENKVESKVNSTSLTRSESMTHVNGHTKVEPTALTMRIISHTTPSGYKRATAVGTSFNSKSQESAQQKEKDSTSSHNSVTRVHSYSSAQIADPSRVPIVRAVELKKSFLQGQQAPVVPEKKQSSTSVKLSWNEMSNQETKTDSINGDDAVETFQGVNNLAKRFSLAASKTEARYNHTTARPVSAYMYGDPKPRADAELKKTTVSVNHIKENGHVSNGINIINGPTNAKKYTSVVGVNGNSTPGSYKEPSSDANRIGMKVPPVPSKAVITQSTKPTGSLNSRHPMPVVKGFRFPTNDFSDSSLVAADSYKSSTNSQQPVTVKVQQSNSFVNSNQRNTIVIEPAPSVSVRIQHAPNSKPSQVPSSVSQQPSVVPSAPALPKKTVQSRPKSFNAPEVNARDQLMDAIRSFGGRGNLRQTNGS